MKHWQGTMDATRNAAKGQQLCLVASMEIWPLQVARVPTFPALRAEIGQEKSPPATVRLTNES